MLSARASLKPPLPYPSPMAIIEMRNVRKTLGGRPVLKGVNLSVNRGEKLVLVGPSGSGKSTLVRCINRLIDVDSGAVLFNGIPVNEMDPIELRRKIGMVFQLQVIFPGTVMDNVSYGLRLMKLPEDEIDRTVPESMRDAGLSSDFLDKDAEKLSGGEQQRVAIARALALDPKVLLLDEPTSALDPKAAAVVEKTIENLVSRRYLTAIWVTHGREQAIRVADRIGVLSNGVLTVKERPENIDWEGIY